MKTAPTFIEFQLPHTVAWAGPDQITSRALYNPKVDVPQPCSRNTPRVSWTWNSSAYPWLAQLDAEGFAWAVDYDRN